MGFFNRKQEIRADPAGMIGVDDALLKALIGSTGVTKSVALQIPTVASAIDLIAGIIASTPIKLYRESEGKTEEVTGDARIALLNDETGDTLNANEFWHAIIRDYYTGKGGYAYINREKGEIKSLHYVEDSYITVQKNVDPIFKDYDFLVGGKSYKPYDFLKILRNTQDGASGIGIVTENSKVLEVAYESLVFESNLVKKGGNKKGFLKAKNKLDKDSLTALKEGFRSLYSNNTSENAIVLNDGIDFHESSNTSVEMQMNENKESNGKELCKIFHMSPDVILGKASESDIASTAKLAAVPLMKTIECALNKDFLLEKEKGVFYWAFDTKELLKGSMKERFEAYKAGIESNVLQIDEVRYMEDLPALGLKWIKLGLDAVLYDVETGKVYTPNTNQSQDLKNLTPAKGGESE